MRPLRKPPGSMLVEMHCHTCEHSPCSEIAAVDLIKRAVTRGLDGVVLTDHHYQWTTAELQTVRQAANCGSDFLLLSGQEVTTRDFDDVLVFGAAESFPFGVPLAHIREQAPAAAIVWAHPWRGINRPGLDRLFSPELDAIEIFNRNHRLVQNRHAYRQWHAWGFTATSGTDVHDELIGVFPTVFLTPVRCIDDLVRAIKENRCRPYLKTSRAAQ
jgi:predicted metal-dependent phosphoesterase TrpH